MERSPLKTVIFVTAVLLAVILRDRHWEKQGRPPEKTVNCLDTVGVSRADVPAGRFNSKDFPHAPGKQTAMARPAGRTHTVKNEVRIFPAMVSQF